MSRIGNQPISLPEGVTVSKMDRTVTAVGPKGNLSVLLPDGISFSQEEGRIDLKRSNDSDEQKALHGLARSLLHNAVVGVSKHFTKTLEVKGVGYRAKATGGKLVLTIGFSHPVEIDQPEGITFDVKGAKIVVSGADKQYVGEIAAKIRRIRPPDSYKGKGIRYDGEYIKLKPGKAAKTAAA